MDDVPPPPPGRLRLDTVPALGNLDRVLCPIPGVAAMGKLVVEEALLIDMLSLSGGLKLAVCDLGTRFPTRLAAVVVEPLPDPTAVSTSDPNAYIDFRTAAAAACDFSVPRSVDGRGSEVDVTACFSTVSFAMRAGPTIIELFPALFTGKFGVSSTTPSDAPRRFAFASLSSTRTCRGRPAIDDTDR